MKRKLMTAPDSDRNSHASTPPSSLLATLLRVAWLAILLGLAMEILLLTLGGALGGVLGLRPVIAEFVKTISWSVFVCVGLAVGTAVVQARAPFMGFMGLLSAPIALEVSRVLHKGTLEALAVSGSAGGGVSPLLVAVIKGIEYGCLGLAIGWVSQRAWGGALAHMAVGLLVGLVFGGIQISIAAGAVPPPPTAALLTQSVNEILFPVGCSLVLFSATALGKKVTSSGQPQR